MDDTTTSNLNPNNLPIQKVTISGPTLSSLLHHLTSSSGPTTGLLYGHLSFLTTTSLSDDDDPSPSTTLTATITGSTLSPTPTPTHNRRIIGHFSTRRGAPFRPSLLDHSRSLATPFILLLLTTPTPASASAAIHTHDYRAYHFRPDSLSFHPLSLEIVNIGPGFRGQYGHFSPTSGLPWLPSVSPRVTSPMSLSDMKRAENDQKELDGYVAGYNVGSLNSLVGADAVRYTAAVEDLYDKMLAKLQGLARVVEASSARVLDQEYHNTKLRRRVAGIE